MANKIREDVVSISFDVENNPFSDINAEIEELKKTVADCIGDSIEELKSMTKAADETTDGLDDLKKAADSLDKVGVDGLTDDLKDTRKQAQESKEEAENLFQKLKKAAGVGFEKTVGGLKSVASFAGKAALSVGKIAAKSIIAGTGAAAVAVGGLVAKSVSGYADYEQLIGGVETLFKDSAPIVEKYANDAYKTAGLSANEYMETVTSFSASLLQSVGGDTEKAAKYADMAISDMSDNANKMGSDMSLIQNAYQGFAKQNYTMLDNLKLGYGGTKEEMARLIKDAAKLDKSIDANSMSYDNIVKAIHAVQVEMGIYGTTAAEADKTITGSIASMKSAWNNLLPALIKGGDSLDQCIGNFVQSVKTVATNLKPAIKSALEGIGSLITELTPIIVAEIPTLVQELLPPLINAAGQLVGGLIKALPSIAKVIVKELPNIVKMIGEAILDAFGVKSPVFEKVGSFLKDNASKIAKFIPAVLGLGIAFKAFGKISSLFGKSKEGGGIFSGITDMFKGLAQAKTGTILKGIANLAIIMVGMTALTAFVMAVAPYMAKLTDVTSFVEVVACIGVLTLVGNEMAKMAGAVGKIPVATVAKGLANMAIVIAGMSALFLLVGAVSLINFDYTKMLKVVGIIGVLGTVGAALSAFAGIVGMIPIPVVLAGLANIALVLGGMSAIVVAFGALSEIKGFTEFIDKGGDLLAKLCGVLGKMVGSVIGGLGEGITNSLPKIGENIAAFATSLKPMFTMFSGVDMSGVGSFFKHIGSFLLQMGGEKVLSFFTGGVDLKGLGEDLTEFAESASGFFTKVATFPENSFTNAKKLFQSLADISNVPNTGGVAQWFSGTNNFSGLADGLSALASEKVVGFFNTVATLPEMGFTNATNLFKALANIGNVPNTGGVAQWFSGENNYSSLAKGLEQLSGDGVMSFFKTVAELPEAGFANAKNLFKTLGSIGKVKNAETLPRNISAIGGALKQFGTDAQTFFEEVTNFKTTKLTELFDALGSAGEKVTPKMINSGVEMMNGLIKGLNSKRSAVLATATSIARAAATAINQALDINSPSGITTESGKDTGMGLVVGMKSMKGKVTEAAQGLSTATATATTPSINKYTPSSSSVSNTNTKNVTNNFNPQFTLNMNGASATQSNKRKVKQWVKESIQETFESMGRTNPELCEV